MFNKMVTPTGGSGVGTCEFLLATSSYGGAVLDLDTFNSAEYKVEIVGNDGVYIYGSNTAYTNGTQISTYGTLLSSVTSTMGSYADLKALASGYRYVNVSGARTSSMSVCRLKVS